MLRVCGEGEKDKGEHAKKERGAGRDDEGPGDDNDRKNTLHTEAILGTTMRRG